MILEQFYLGCLAHASYVIADEQTGEALLVDPQRDIATYEALLQERGLRPIGVALTHFHADFLAGHIEMRDKYHVPIYLGAAAEAEFDFTPLADGDEINVGSIVVRALSTPGHTPEGTSYVVFEHAGAQPHAVLTGDTMFIGDVGRPDLLASVGVTSEELAGMLYRSLRDKLLKLPDETLVYPAHGAGSLCGKNLSNETVSTIGAQRRENYALQPMSEAEFIELVTADQPESPAYFGHDATLNKQERDSLDEVMARTLHELNVDATREHVAKGIKVIDVRDADTVHRGFMRGTINIGLHGTYATWAGSLLAPGEPIVVIAERADAEEAVMRLGRIGYDQVLGWIAWEDLSAALSADELAQTERVNADTVDRLREGGVGIVDVRAPKEFALGHLDEAENVPLQHLAETAADWPRDKPLLVHCAGGYRSSAAVTVLIALGFTEVYDLKGGYKAVAAAA